MIYKILTETQWQDFSANGMFTGAPVDVQDGFIHLSTQDQVAETARKHFSGASSLVLVAIDPATLGDGLRYEVSRGGAEFPHYYGRLEAAHVVFAKALPLRADGLHDFRGLLT